MIRFNKKYIIIIMYSDHSFIHFFHYLDFVAENMSTYPRKTHGWGKLAGNLPTSRPDVMQIAGEQL